MRTWLSRLKKTWSSRPMRSHAWVWDLDGELATHRAAVQSTTVCRGADQAQAAEWTITSFFCSPVVARTAEDTASVTDSGVATAPGGGLSFGEARSNTRASVRAVVRQAAAQVRPAPAITSNPTRRSRTRKTAATLMQAYIR